MEGKKKLSLNMTGYNGDRRATSDMRMEKRWRRVLRACIGFGGVLYGRAAKGE